MTRYKASTAPKLGSGGLIRAYGQAARDCLKTAAAARAAAPTVALELAAGPAAYGAVRGLLAAWEHRGVRVAAEDFADDGAARLSLRLDDAGLRDDLSREAEAAGATVER